MVCEKRKEEMTDRYNYRPVDHGHLEQLRIFKEESYQVRTAVALLTDFSIGGGVGFFRGDVRMENVPPELLHWMGTLDSVLYDVLDSLACYGFVAYAIEPATGNPSVLEASRLRLHLRRTLYGSTELCATLRDDPRGTAGGDYGMYIDPEIRVITLPGMFDWVSGRNQGRLAQCLNTYSTMVVLTRNQLTISTGNAQPVFLMDHTDRKQVQGYIEAATDPLAGDFEESIPNYTTSTRDRLVARARITRTIHLDDQELSKDLEQIQAVLPGLGSRLKIPAINPAAGTFVPVPAGRTTHQRAYAPESANFVQNMVFLNRLIADAFEVPCRLTERGSGHTVEKLDQEMDSLKSASMTYTKNVNMVLADISRVVLDPIVIGAHLRLYELVNREVDKCVDLPGRILKVVGGEKVVLRIASQNEFRESLQLFDNFMITWEEMQDVCVRTGRGKYGGFEKEDPREKRMEVGGPGRKGESTLGVARHDEQRGTRGYSSGRAAAKPGQK